MRRCLRSSDFFPAVRALKAVKASEGRGWSFVCPVCQVDELEIPRGRLDTFTPNFTAVTCSHGCEPEDIAEHVGLRVVARADDDMSAEELWDELPERASVEDLQIGKTLGPLIRAVAREPVIAQDAWVERIAKGWGVAKGTLKRVIREESKPTYQAPRPRPVDICDGSSLNEALKDVEISYQGRIPKGWEVLPSGIYRESLTAQQSALTVSPDDEQTARGVRVLPAALVIESVLRDYDTGTVRWALAWRSHTGWRRVQPLSQGEVAQARTVVKLADFGVPVTSNTAREVVDWLAAYYDWNRRDIPTRVSTDRLGWVGGGFLLGATWHGDGEAVEPQPGGALEQITLALSQAGDRDVERAAVAELAAFPAVLALLGAGLATPLLEPLSLEPFTVIVSGRSGMGKTRAVTCALAAWGATGHTDRTMRRSWNSTSNAITSLVTLCRGIPVFLDELQQVRDEGLAKRVIYDMSSGQGRGRSDRSGAVRALPTSKTIILTTGEHTVMAEARERGMHARALELTCAPWGGESVELGETVDRLARTLDRNHGHTASEWVRFVVASKVQHGAWQARVDSLASDVSAMLRSAAPRADKAMCSRVARHIAAIRVALDLAVESGALQATDAQRAAAAWVLVEEAARSLNECDPAITALVVVVEAVTAQRGLFFDPCGDRKEGRDGGWVGRIDDRYLAFTASWLSETFRRNDLGRVGGALAKWSELGLVERGDGANLQRKFRVGYGSQAPLVRLIALDLQRVGELTGSWLSGREQTPEVSK